MKHGASPCCIKSMKANATREAVPCHVGHSLIASIISPARRTDGAALLSHRQTAVPFHIQLLLKASNMAHLHLLASFTQTEFKTVSSARWTCASQAPQSCVFPLWQLCASQILKGKKPTHKFTISKLCCSLLICDFRRLDFLPSTPPIHSSESRILKAFLMPACPLFLQT